MAATQPPDLLFPPVEPSPAPTPSSGTIHDAMYYMQDEMLVFLVRLSNSSISDSLTV
jgi:hypothetical protein